MSYKSFAVTASLFFFTLTSCATGPIEMSDTISAYGPVSVDRVANHPETGFFYARYLGDTYKPSKLWGGYVTPEQKLFVVDAAIELRTAGTEPYYRVHFYPRDMDTSIIAGWDDWFSIKMSPVLGGKQKITLHARLPEDRTLDEQGNLSTDWTYCSACIASFDSTTASYYRRMPTMRSSISDEGNIRFYASPTIRPDAFGQAAIEKAGAVYAEREKDRLIAEENARLARERAAEEQRLYGAARAEYATLEKEFFALSLTGGRKASCGDLDLEEPPHPADAFPEDYEYIAEDNAEAFERHMNCVIGMLAEIDYDVYQRQIDGLNEVEALLWQAVHLPDDQRLTPLDLDTMLVEQENYLQEVEARYEENGKDLQYAYDDWFEYQEEQAELARKAWIEEETQVCLMGLAAAGNLTPYSQGYCRGLAEQGYSGSDAAMMNNRLALQNRRRPGGGAQGNLLYQRPGMQTFDIQGMMDNARAAADGNTQALWDRSGAIRTSRAPGVPVGGGVPNKRRAQGNDAGGPTPSTLATADTNVSGATDRSRTAETETASASGSTSGEDAFPTRHYVTFIMEEDMQNGEIKNFSGARVSIPGTGDTGRIGRIEPFVTSTRTCSANLSMQATLREVVYVIWDNATREQVAAMEQRAASDPFLEIAPYGLSGPASNDFETVKSAIGSSYRGQPVHWMPSHRFVDQNGGGNCRKVIWNGVYEQLLPVR